MRRVGRRGAAALLLAAGLALGACSDDGNKDAFCDRLGETPDVAEILATVDSGDPAGTETALREGIRHYRALEADAPGEVRADLARLRQGVELVLQAVEDNPDDLPAARQQITGQADELAGLAQAGQRVATYASSECGISLGDEEVDGPGVTDDTGTTPTDGTEPDGGG